MNDDDALEDKVEHNEVDPHSDDWKYSPEERVNIYARTSPTTERMKSERQGVREIKLMSRERDYDAEHAESVLSVRKKESKLPEQSESSIIR